MKGQRKLRRKARRMLDVPSWVRGAGEVIEGSVRGAGIAMQPAPYQRAMLDALDAQPRRVVCQVGSAMGKTTELVPVAVGPCHGAFAIRIGGTLIRGNSYSEVSRLVLVHMAQARGVAYVVDVECDTVTTDSPGCPAWVGALRARDRYWDGEAHF